MITPKWVWGKVYWTEWSCPNTLGGNNDTSSTASVVYWILLKCAEDKCKETSLSMVKCIKLGTQWIPSEPLAQVSLACSEVDKAWEE